ncbi:MAG TPA: hypothetical protein ENJ23_02510 [Bacteroidetes bacterium]|nr:hypothetical protein [Bacteroidota bacterium]
MATPERILLYFPGALGDTLLLRPVWWRLKKAFPHISVDLAANAGALPLLRHELGQTFSAGARDFLHIFSPYSDWPEPLRKRMLSYRALAIWSGGYPEVSLESCGSAKVLRAPSRPPEGKRVHASAWLLETLKTGRILPGSRWRYGDIPPLEIPRPLADPFRARMPFVVIHPGSGSPRKNWPLPGFLCLAGAVQAELGLKIVWLLGPGEEELEAELPPGAFVFQKRPLLEVASLLQKASAVIGNDSGIAHLAGQLGVLAVVLFVSTDPAVWHPLGSAVHVLTSAEVRQPEIRGIHFHILPSLAPGEVLPRILSVLKNSLEA